MGTSNYDLPLILGTASAKVPRDLNALANSIDSLVFKELNKLGVQVRFFGAVGDFNPSTLTGADDTESIQAAFDYARTNKIPRIVFESGKKYKISNRIITTQNGLEVDVQGSEIIWYNLTNVVNQFPTVRESWIGALEFVGERLESTKTNVTGYSTYEGYAEVNSSSMTKMGKFTVANAGAYTVGDNVYISIPTKAPGDYNVAVPLAYTHAKIIKIAGNNIYTDFYSPYPFWQNRVFDSEDYMVKLNPIRDIKVKRMTFNDLNPHMQLDFLEPNGVDVNKQVSGVVFNYGDGFTLEDYHAIGTHYSAVETYGSRNILIKDSSSRDAKYNGAGKGYGIHFYHSMNMTIENFTCQNMRHTIDFSSSSFGLVDNCHGSGHEEFSFTLHGECEHNITYENCSGSAKVGHGVLFFADLNANVQYINCDIPELKLSWCDNTVFENSRVHITGSAYHLRGYEMYIGKVHFKDCDVRIPNFKYFMGSKRGNTSYKTKLLFSNCEVNGVASGDTGQNAISFIDIDNFAINGCQTNLTNINGRFIVRGVARFSAFGNEFKNSFFQFDPSTTYFEEVFEDNTFIVDDSYVFFTAANVQPIKWARANSKGSSRFKRNTFMLNSNSLILQPLRIPNGSTDFLNSSIDFYNEDTKYILNGSANVAILTEEYAGIRTNIKDAVFVRNGTGVFTYSAAFNISETNLIMGVPTAKRGTPPATLNTPRQGHYTANINSLLGEPKGWTFTGSEWIPDIQMSNSRTIADASSYTFTLSSINNKRGMFFLNVDIPASTYAIFISDGSAITVINKSANVNIGSVIPSALNVEIISGNVKITNNLGASRKIALNCMGF